MPAKIYHVKLTEEERETLNALVKKGKGVARRLTRSRILLLADENREDGGWKDADIAQALGVSQRTVERVREKSVMQGIESALNHTRPKQTKATCHTRTMPTACHRSVSAAALVRQFRRRRSLVGRGSSARWSRSASDRISCTRNYLL